MLLLAPRPAAGQCSGPSFALPPYPGAVQPNAPWAVATGDFFGPDGILDVVTTLDGSGEVVLLGGNGTGNLFPGTPVAVGANPQDVVAADFDRDGKLDIAVATSGATSLSLLPGTGATFGAALTEDLTWNPSRLATGDLDHDGMADLVVVGETAGKVRVLLGDGDLTFTLNATFDLTGASAVAVGDFDRNGWGDLAVTRRTANAVQIYLGSDAGGGVLLLTPGVSVPVGTDPADVVTADVNYDGRLDLVTADRTSGSATVLLGNGDGTFPNSEVINSAVPALVFPTRVAILDFDRDGGLDLALLDEGSTPPQVMVFPAPARGDPPPPPSFDTANPVVVPLTAASAPKGLAIGDLLKDGRPDLVVAETSADKVVVAPNTAAPDCARPSFYEAPRAYLGGDEPVWVAAADFVEDGIEDMVVASKGTLEVLRGTGNGYSGFANVDISPLRARGIATADFNFDGHADVVAAIGDASNGEVRLYLGDGGGGFGAPLIRPVGNDPSAVVVGDFNADGAPDAALTSQGGDQVHIFIGDGQGGLAEEAESPLGVGIGPGALATGDLDNNGTLDLVVANSFSNTISIFLGDIGGGGAADGTFTLAGTPTMGAGPWGVALGNFNGDGLLDVVTADHDAGPSTATVRLGTGGGAFGPADPQSVAGVPISVAAFDVTGDGKDDVSVVTGNQTLAVLPGVGDGSFLGPAYHAMRPRPSAIVPIDADSDGKKDLAIPCKDADSVVVLLTRPPGFAEAVSVAVGAAPTDIATADLDDDGDLDLVVVDSAGPSVTVLIYDYPSGTFVPQAPLPVGASPESVAIADLDSDGILDFAVSATAAGHVAIFEGLGGASFVQRTPVVVATPDDLVAGDFDRDGAPDLAVCTKQSTPGNVTILKNLGGFSFTPLTPTVVGDVPTAIVTSDFNLDGRPDVAVANDNSNTLTVLYGDGAGAFPTSDTLTLILGDTSPVSIAAGDFDGDGDDDLATVAFGADMLSVFDNKRALLFPDAPVRIDASYKPLFVGSGDLNRDGRADLALGAEGVRALAGQGALAFGSSEDLVAGLVPSALALGDFNQDGRPDIAVANLVSNDVSILFSTACLPRRIVVTTSPAGCGTVGPLTTSIVEVQDDAGNVAVCETGNFTAAIVPGTGTGGAILGGTNPQAATAGVATFPDLTINLAGPRYELEYTLSGLAPAISRSFSLGSTVAITGPLSICPTTSETYNADPGFDTYKWTVDGTPSDWRQSTVLSNPPLATGTSYTLAIEARVDTCAPTDTKSIYVGNLASVTISPSGTVTVCVDCLGGTVTATDTGGGAPLEHQWGYRTVSTTGPITNIAGQTADTYVISGLDFPGVGTFYLVETTTPVPPSGCGGPVTSNEVTVTITATVPSGEVQSLGATSRGPSGVGENILQWVNTNGSTEEVLIRWNQAAPGDPSICAAPADALVALADGQMSIVYNPPNVPSKDARTHTGLVLDTAYCYSVFVKVSSVYSPGRTVKARPFASDTDPVKWAYASGATAVVPPTVAGDGILAVSNDRSVHSLERGILGGTWPASWVPTVLDGVAHSRSPVVPFGAQVAGADALLFAGDDSGKVTAVNVQTGQVAWGPIAFAGTMVTGAPGGLFVQYGGPADVILVGTRNVSAGPSQFYTLDLSTGAVLLPTFDGTAGALLGLGQIMSTPSLDYTTGRAYITSWRHLGTEPSVWCLQIKPDGTIEPIPVWTQTLGDISVSPVLVNGRVYVANTTGQVYSLDAADGTRGPPYPTGDGPVKGFLFPNRMTGDLYFATDTMVQSVTDTAGTLAQNWSFNDGGSLEPSIVLHWPETDLLFVGSKDGTLWQIDFSAVPTLTTTSQVLGDGQGHIGAPSLDIGVVPPDVSAGKKLLHVGSESGVLYAVEVPLP